MAAHEYMLWYRISADAILLLHAAIVCFVVLGPVFIIVGNMRRWRWVNARPFRAAHAAAILVVIAQSWVGIACPLTTFEAWLRRQAGLAAYSGGFVEYWLQRFLYYDFPSWAFTLAYTVFGLVVLAAWWRFPPYPRRMKKNP